MKTKTLLIMVVIFFLVGFQANAIVCTPFIEALAFHADYVVVAKYKRSVKIKVSSSYTYTIDVFVLDRVLVNNKESKFAFLVCTPPPPPDVPEITDDTHRFHLFRLVSNGMCPPIPDPEFKENSLYILVLKSLNYSFSNRGLYSPAREFQAFPIATKKRVKKFMTKYKEIDKRMNR